MIYYTGDIHGQKYDIERFCKRFNPTRDDIIVILGDVGANYGQDERDAELKFALNKLKSTIFCIHGNHEIRPWHIPTYKTKEWHGGVRIRVISIRRQKGYPQGGISGSPVSCPCKETRL